ncbi:hypothetical protein [Motilimonas sp. KMU-193]|uniref:hypothetical protein n=1 Tax=Motilimonas sp. KMU-193 TaxID=3388668 RepID=UPI00396B0AEB
MNPLDKFIKQGYELFSCYEKPEQCIDHQGDFEYLEYEKSLTGVMLDDLEMNHLGHICWGPLSALGAEAIAYYMPKLIEFALLGLNDKADEPFFNLFTLVIGDPVDHERFSLLGYEQRNYIYRTFLLLKGLNFRDEHLVYGCYDDYFDEAIENWKT